MIQQQLVDYIKSQVGLGAAAETIKTALLGAGWAEADVNDSLASAGMERSIAAKPEKPGGAGFSLNVGAGAKPEISKENYSRKTPIVVSDLVGDIKPDLAAKKEADKKFPEAKKPEIAQETIKKEKTKMTLPKFGKAAVAVAVLGILVLASAGGAAFFYLQNKDLQVKLSAASSENNTINGKVADLNSQVSALNGSNGDLNSQIASLKSENQESATELSFLAVPPEASSTEKMDFTVQGTIGGGSGGQYTLTTKHGVKIYVQNYKDGKVDAALKPLVGQTAEISGNHFPGSRNVAATAVNGSPIIVPAPVSGPGLE